MSNNLIIVESPAKAKTIEKFLGKDFMVKSSFGHIRDLPSKGMNIDLESGSFEPNYEVNTDKKKIVAELRKAAKDRTVWLAADEDREGEAIAWHVCTALKLDPKTTKRIIFNEITKPAIVNSVKNPTVIDQNLVNAQQARRVLDRIVGYELSPVLWKKVRTGLSAGRVQSVAVRLIVEKEREIKQFESNSTYKITADFPLTEDAILQAIKPKNAADAAQAELFLNSCIGSEFAVESISKKDGVRRPSAPFTTSTLQQAASTRLGFSVKRTMMAAQKLYESGKITYMRTDSVNLSDTAIASASAAIEQNYGSEYLKVRKYKGKSGAQEAHEAIRPTDFGTVTAGAESDQIKLYNLIWARAIASQMSDAKVEKTKVDISISKSDEILVAEGEVLMFDGFLKVYPEKSGDKLLPPLSEGQALPAPCIMAKETFSRPPARYTEASLVKKLDEMEIGRPSTYAPTISTIQTRQYVDKPDLEGKERNANILTLDLPKTNEIKTEVKVERTGADKNKLVPTDIGEMVNDFLVEHFSEIVDYDFTKNVEKEFDEIADGKKVWNKMIGEFYTPFHKTVDSAADISRDSVQKIREIGTDPKSGKPIFARMGRFGPMIQIGDKDDEEKPTFASIPEGFTIDSIDQETALKQFEFPKNIGKTPDGDDILVSLGRFGPYMKIGALNVSLKKDRKDRETGETIPGDNPHAITLDRAIELWEEKKLAEERKYVDTWEDVGIQILRGPYGIYIKSDEKGNVRIPKSVEAPEKLTKDEAIAIVEKAPIGRGAKKKPAAKKTAAKKAPAKKKAAAKKAPVKK